MVTGVSWWLPGPDWPAWAWPSRLKPKTGGEGGERVALETWLARFGFLCRDVSTQSIERDKEGRYPSSGSQSDRSLLRDMRPARMP